MGFLKRSEKQEKQPDKGEQAERWAIMASSRFGLSKKLPYLVVQEGIWKNKATERVREFLASKFSDRAEIELRYIRLLQDWLDELDPPRDHNDASDSYIDSQIVKTIVECLKKEANGQISARQKVYNSIMNDLGPYSAIRREVQSHSKNLDWVLDQFKIISAEDKRTEREYRIHTEKKEHISNQVETLDQQLVHRSRITSARRMRGQGAKKIDGMRQRVSFLRKQLMDEEECILASQRDLLNLETKTTGELSKMETILKDLEKIRIQNIIQQTRLFIQSMLNQQSHSRRPACMADTLRQCLKDVTQIETYVDRHWEDVESNALRAQAGQTFKLRQLFEVQPKRPKSADSRKSVDSLKIAEIEANRLIDLDGLSKINISPKSSKQLSLARKASLNSPIPEESLENKSPMPENKSPLPDYPKEGSDNRTGKIDQPEENRRSTGEIDQPEENRRTTGKIDQPEENRRTTVVRFSPEVAEYIEVDSVISETSIEEIQLPPETRYPRRSITPRPPIARNGWLNSPDSSRPENDWSPDCTKVSSINSSIESPRIFSRDGEVDIGKHRDIRVTAIADYTAMAPGELTFKKGQVIKQKMGEDERGYCFGWTREHMLFPKRYGYYPKSLVCLDGFQ